MTFDFQTPDRNEEQADYAAARELGGSRKAEYNVEDNVKWWLEQKIPGMF